MSLPATERPSYGDVKASVAEARATGSRFFEVICWQIEHEVWTVLGYASWDEMREAEYEGIGVVCPRADRPEIVARMRKAGLTQQQIADTAGVSRPTVASDLLNADSDIETVINARGQERPATYTKPPAPRPIGEVGRGAGQTREGEEPEAPVPPASEPAPSIAVPPRPPVDALADAVAEFPEVAYFAEKGDPGKAIETARNLRGYSEREQPMRRENLRKWIAADQRGAFDKKPTREVTGTDVMQALATAFGYVARAGGIDRVADDLLAEDPDALDFNRTALDQYAAQLGDLIDALVPTLRRIK